MWHHSILFVMKKIQVSYKDNLENGHDSLLLNHVKLPDILYCCSTHIHTIHDAFALCNLQNFLYQITESWNNSQT